MIYTKDERGEELARWESLGLVQGFVPSVSHVVGLLRGGEAAGQRLYAQFRAPTGEKALFVAVSLISLG